MSVSVPFRLTATDSLWDDWLIDLINLHTATWDKIKGRTCENVNIYFLRGPENRHSLKKESQRVLKSALQESIPIKSNTKITNLTACLQRICCKQIISVVNTLCIALYIWERLLLFFSHSVYIWCSKVLKWYVLLNCSNGYS